MSVRWEKSVPSNDLLKYSLSQAHQQYGLTWAYVAVEQTSQIIRWRLRCTVLYSPPCMNGVRRPG